MGLGAQLFLGALISDRRFGAVHLARAARSENDSGLFARIPPAAYTCMRENDRQDDAYGITTPMSRRFRASFGPILASSAFSTVIESYPCFLLIFSISGRVSPL